MHLENYAPKGDAPAAPGGVDETSSRFVASFQTAVAGLRKHHLSRFPTQAEFALRGLQWLAGRCVRASHCMAWHVSVSVSCFLS